MSSLEITDQTISFKTLTSKVDKDDSFKKFVIKNVKIEGGERDMIDFSKSFRGHPCIREFEASNVTVLDSSVDIDQVLSILMITCPKFETLKLEKMPVSASSVSTIGFCSTLKTLELRNCGLKDSDAAGIAQAIAQSSSLEKVDVSGNDMSDPGCIAFAAALDKNLSLQTLCLDGNEISVENRSKIDTKLQQRSGGVPQAA